MNLIAVQRLKVLGALTALVGGILAVVLGLAGVWHPLFACVEAISLLGLAAVLMPVARLPRAT